MLETHGLNVFYGDLQALWDVSIEVKSGELVVLVGPNGAGKTTTLRCLSGIIPATGGVTRICGFVGDST